MIKVLYNWSVFKIWTSQNQFNGGPLRILVKI